MPVGVVVRVLVVGVRVHALVFYVESPNPAACRCGQLLDG
jgi:hypothetical protein